MKTVKDLIAMLQTLDQDTILICSKDSEGNSYSPFLTIEDGYYYVPETTWCGDVYHFEDEYEYDAEEWDDILSEGKPAVVIWPTN